MALMVGIYIGLGIRHTIAEKATQAVQARNFEVWELEIEINRMQEEIQALQNLVKLRESDLKPELVVDTVSEGKVAPSVNKATVTAYACDGITTEAERRMNCPSTIGGNPPKTANGETPVPWKTMACDPANMGRTFEIEGVGEVRCNDTGGSVKGSGRFDLYVEDIQTAINWGVQQRNYTLID